MEQYKLPSHNNPDKVFIVNRSELEGRIDPYFFKKEFDVISDKLSHIETLPLKKVSVKIFSGITPLSGGDSYTDRENGIAFIRSGDYSEDNIIDFSYTNYITTSVHNGIMSSSKIKKGDLLIAIVGATIGKVGIYNYDEEANINQAICAIRLKEQFIPEFIHIYLLTELGQKILDRLKRPVARANINLEEISSIQIPQITRTRQKEVVDFYYNKIDLKQQKEAEAKALLDSIDSYLLGELGITLPEKDNSLQKRVFTSRFSEVVGRRLDTNFFLEEFKYIEREIADSTYSTFALKELFHINRGGSPRPINDYFTESEDGLNWIKIGDTKDDDLYIESTKQKIIQEGAKYSRKVEIGDFLLSNSMSFGRPYISNIEGYIHDGWLLFRPKEKINNIFMHTLLGSKLMYKLFGKATIGGVVENLNIDLVKQIRIPLPPLEKQNEIAQHIQSTREQAKQLQNDARAILEQAKKEVELMILG